MRRILISLTSVFIIFLSGLPAITPLTLSDNQEKYHLGGSLEILRDPGGQLTVDDVSSEPYRSRFTPSREKVPNIGFTADAVWVRFTLLNRASSRSPWALELLYPSMHHAHLYQLSPSGDIVKTSKTGTMYPVETRDHPHHHLIFLLVLPRENPQTIYIRFQNSESMTIPLILWSMTEFMNQSQSGHLIQGIFMGILLIMIGFHLFLYTSLKDRSYLYYSISITAILLFSLTSNGIGFAYLWPNRIHWNQLSLPLFAGLMVMAIVKFTDYFLMARRDLPLLHKITNIYLAAMGLLALSSLVIKYRIIISPMVFMGITGAALISINGFASWIKKYRPARYFLLGVAAISISGTLHLLVRMGAVPSLPLLESGFSLGIIVFVLLMSLALADRVKILRSEKEKATRELQESEERFRSLVETTSDFIWEVDRQGVYTYASPNVRDILGYHPEELINRSQFDFMPPEDASRLLALLEKSGRDRKPLMGIRSHYRKKNGELAILDKNGLPFFNPEGELQGFRGIDRDITERTRLEEDQEKLRSRVQYSQKLESLGILAGGIAHDFNNLLMGILGNASLAKKNLSHRIESEQYLNKIEKSSQQAAQLTNQMLAYSGKGRFIVQPINLSQLVEEISQLLSASISKKVTIRYDFDSNLPQINGDASQISQIIMNLIVNASEAIGDRNGLITVRTGVMSVDRNYLADTYIHEQPLEGEYVFLEVSDNGMGMDKETQKKIFDPFFTTKFRGHGLGLAAVLGIVRGHQGAIKVYSEPGRGTTIKVLFPVVEGEAFVYQKKEPPGPFKLSGRTVLVVDDEPTVLDVVGEMLRNSGMKVFEASNGREGVAQFKRYSHIISLVILDTTMPEMNGEEVFRELRKIDPNIKVILTSGYNEQDATSYFVGKGLAGFIQKPFTLHNLMAKLNELADDL